MANEPKIEVIEEAVTYQQSNTGMAGSIAVIGAFDSTINEITVCQNATAAHQIFGTSTEYGTFKGTDDIDLFFIGATELIVANITTWTEAETPEPETTLTNQKLADALAKLKNEEFDMLFIAEELTDAAQSSVTTWVNSEFKGKLAHGQVAQVSRASAAAYEATAATFDKGTYYINTQTFGYNGIQLDLNRSTALMAGLIAGMDVNRSLTAKVIPGITSVSPEYTTEAGDIGAKLLELNIPFIKPRNRRLNRYVCVNSKMPNGLDMYHNRSRDYIINRIAVETYLGELNNDRTIEGISTLMETLKEEFINTLGICKDLIYYVEKTSTECIDIVIEKIVFDGVITDIKIRYSIEVQ